MSLEISLPYLIYAYNQLRAHGVTLREGASHSVKPDFCFQLAETAINGIGSCLLDMILQLGFFPQAALKESPSSHMLSSVLQLDTHHQESMDFIWDADDLPYSTMF